jgi:hypothetical protein
VRECCANQTVEREVRNRNADSGTAFPGARSNESGTDVPGARKVLTGISPPGAVPCVCFQPASGNCMDGDVPQSAILTALQGDEVVYVCVCVCMHVFMYVYMCVCMCVCVFIWGYSLQSANLTALQGDEVVYVCVWMFV